jgi:methionyl-tRNA formyltransferase
MITIQKNYNSSYEPTYIFASCKDWHRASFDLLCNNPKSKWIYVSNTSELEDAVSKNYPTYIFFLHWSWIIDEAIWKSFECVCFHMTNVPYGRGGSPLQNLILAGHSHTVLTALRMVKEIDAGPVYAKRYLSLDGTAEDVYLRSGKLSIEIIQWMILNNPQPMPQEGVVTIFKRRKPEQSNLPINGNLRDAYDFIRMLDASGYPRAFVENGVYKLTFRNARIGENKIIAEVEIRMKEK